MTNVITKKYVCDDCGYKRSIFADVISADRQIEHKCPGCGAKSMRLLTEEKKDIDKI